MSGKLYWRITKKDGTRTWIAATESNTREDDDIMELVRALRYVEEEEE